MLSYFKLQYIKIITLRAYKSNNWKKIPIKENHQPLIIVPSEFAFPYYFKKMRLTNDNVLYLREETFNRFLKAKKYLQCRGFNLKVYDGWRSAQLQENLYWYYMYKFTARKFNQKELFGQLSGLNEIKTRFEKIPKNLQTAMHRMNQIYVSWPSKKLISPSPHATGGAVDVWPFKNNKPVDLGVPFDYMDDSAGAFYHLKTKRKCFSNDLQVCHNRECLLLAMVKAGFSCYEPEIWHFNYGNQMDALVKKSIACYSYVEP